MINSLKNSLSLATFILFFISTTLAAQDMNSKVDSLTTALDEAITVEGRFDIYHALANVYTSINPDSALWYGQQMLLEQKTVPVSERLSDAHGLLSSLYYRFGRYDSAYHHTQQHIEILEANPEFPNQTRHLIDATMKLGRLSSSQEQESILRRALTLDSITPMDSATIYNSLGNVLYQDTRYDESLECFNYTISFARKTGNKRLEAMGLNNASEPLATQKRFKLAEEYIERATKLAEELGASEGVIHCTRSLAFLYQDMGDRKRAAEIMREALVKSRALNHHHLIGLNINSLLYLHDTTMSRDLELESWAKADLDARDPNARDMNSDIHAGMAYYYSMHGLNDRVIYHGKSALLGQRAMGADSSIYHIVTLEVLADAQRKTGDYRSAARNFQQVTRLRMAQETKREEKAFAQTAIQMELTENKLSRERAEAAVALEQQASAARTRLFGIAALAAALIFGVLLWAYRRNQKAAQRIAQQKALVEQSLSEKEVLLREIHHRVKNNLQIISGMLGKQARIAANPDLQKMVDEGKERIQSMALIHQNLYESDKLSGVNIRTYLEELGQNITQSQAGKNIELVLDVTDETLDLDTAIPIGLILNELLTNSYKYAFPDQQNGKVTVGLEKQANNSYELRVSDNGVGIIDPERFSSGKTLGVNLVRGLVRQLRGTVEWLKPERGTEVMIRFQAQTA